MNTWVTTCLVTKEERIENPGECRRTIPVQRHASWIWQHSSLLTSCLKMRLLHPVLWLVQLVLMDFSGMHYSGHSGFKLKTRPYLYRQNSHVRKILGKTIFSYYPPTRHFTFCRTSAEVLIRTVPICSDNAIHDLFCRSSVAVPIRTERKMPRGLIGSFKQFTIIHSLCELWNMTCRQTFPQNFGTTWNFFHKVGFVWCGTPMGLLPDPLLGSSWPSLWVLLRKQSVY